MDPSGKKLKGLLSVTVRGHQEKTCMIVLTAAGPRVDYANIFSVSVKGPNDISIVKDKGFFSANGTRTIKNLSPGQYQIVIDTEGGHTRRCHAI